MKNIFFSFTIIFSVLVAKADEGMWLLSRLNRNYSTLQEMGLTISIEDIYNIDSPSMKDAVVIFGGGCTGEIISAKGLLLTNHHCGYNAVQSLSTPQNNILCNGFWASSFAEEIPCEGLSVSFFLRMEDVTDMVLFQLDDHMPEPQRNDSIVSRSRKLEKEYNENNKYWVRVVPMFQGNEYYIFTYQVYRDVRLVGVPTENLGKFGGEIDNWTWPRHTADFSLFRVYTDKDGNPATYSNDNIPYVPKWYFSISTAGVKEDDFAMIIGYPGSTDRYLTSFGVKMAIEERNPTIVNVRETKLNSWKGFRKSDPVIDLQYASKYAAISNYWKYYIGQTKQLINNKVLYKKSQLENEFQIWVIENKKQEYYGLLSNIENDYAEISKHEKFNILYQQAIFGGAEIFSWASQLRTLNELIEKLENNSATDEQKKQINTRLSQIRSRLTNFFKNYNPTVDKATSAKLFRFFFNETTSEQRPPIFDKELKKAKYNFNKLTDNLFANTMFANKNLMEKFLESPNSKTLAQDKAFIWYNSFLDIYHQTREPLDPYFEALKKHNRLFIRGLMEMNPDKLFAPDANSQIRLTYGKVCGYQIKDGLIAQYFTTLDGVIAKEDIHVKEFTIPEKLKALHQSKDYGQYADNGQLHVCFLTNNDITGGNSGSPVINGKGELVGCAFDGNWEAMSGDIFFEPTLQRCINVDIRYILFLIEKFAGANHLIDELTIIRD